MSDELVERVARAIGAAQGFTDLGNVFERRPGFEGAVNELCDQAQAALTALRPGDEWGALQVNSQESAYNAIKKAGDLAASRAARQAKEEMRERCARFVELEAEAGHDPDIVRIICEIAVTMRRALSTE